MTSMYAASTNPEAKDEMGQVAVTTEQEDATMARAATTLASRNDLLHHVISARQRQIVNKAMALLPDELTSEYRQACRFVPELVDKESDLRWFLRYVEKMEERERKKVILLA
jgi:hypothetical protein